MKRKNMIKELNMSKNILLNIVLLLTIILLIFILVYNFKLTKLERVKIDEFDKKTSSFMEEYVDSEDEGKYIVFSIKYLNNKYNKNEFTIEEVIRTINSTFDLKYNKQKIYRIGITERMLEDGIVFEDSKGVFKYNDQKTRSDIAKTKVIKYELKKVSKKSKNKFVLTYNKYVVDDPYKVLNYYNDKNDTNKIIVTSSYLNLGKYLLNGSLGFIIPLSIKSPNT